MTTPKPHAGLADVAMPPPFASANVVMAAYADMVRTAFEITHELGVEAMTLMHRATEYWLTQSAQYRAELETLGPWTPLMGAEPMAEGEEAEIEAIPAPHEGGADTQDDHDDDDDDKCCGDACTSKACKRVLKSLELAASDFR
jgi:hypothetical protein